MLSIRYLSVRGGKPTKAEILVGIIRSSNTENIMETMFRKKSFWECHVIEEILRVKKAYLDRSA